MGGAQKMVRGHGGACFGVHDTGAKNKKSKRPWRGTGVTCQAFWGTHCDQCARMDVLEQGEGKGTEQYTDGRG